MSELHQGDCLEVMKQIPEGSVDLILTDPPYGTTACKWDTVIPFEPMWKELKRIIKPNGVIALFGSEPFSSLLRCSNLKDFKYDWTWEKTRPTGSMLCRKRPLLKSENISIFYKIQPFYNPQMQEAKRVIEKERVVNKGETKNNCKLKRKFDNKGLSFPRNIIKFKNSNHKSFHPTQKPVELLKYLIKTYTLENETVLDFTMGSGSTGVACKQLNRKFIGIELDEKYFKIAEDRINGELL